MWYIFASIYYASTCLPLGLVLTLLTDNQAVNSRPARCGIILSHSKSSVICVVHICDIWYMWYIFALICIPPTWRSVNTVNWRSGSRRTSSAVWDISLPFQTKPSRTLFPSAYFITSHYINQRWTYTMPHIAACTVHWNISPLFKNLICYKFPINITHFTWM